MDIQELWEIIVSFVIDNFSKYAKDVLDNLVKIVVLFQSFLSIRDRFKRKSKDNVLLWKGQAVIWKGQAITWKG